MARAVENLLRTDMQDEKGLMAVPCIAALTEVQPHESLQVPLL